jgi:S1-C subfamily serine protease
VSLEAGKCLTETKKAIGITLFLTENRFPNKKTSAVESLLQNYAPAQSFLRSVVLLVMNDSNGQPLCLGSGFFVSDDVVATNAHVIQGAGSGSAKLGNL